MVHRKSEYRLNYKWLPSNVCRDGRLTSADYRIQRRRSDFSHHSWGWQLDRCDCEEDDECDRYLPLPPNRQKHNQLIEQWRKGEMTRYRFRDNELNTALAAEQETTRLPQTTAAGVHFPLTSTSPVAAVDISSKRPELTRIEKYDTYQPTTYNEITTPANLNAHAEREIGKSTRPLMEYQPSQQQQQPMNTELQEAQNFEFNRRNDVGHLQEGLALVPRLLDGDEVTLAGGIRRNLPVEPRRKKTDITPVEPSLRPVRWRSPSPIKKLSPKPRVSTISKPRTPFHSYGWANVVDSVGKQETRNVRSQAAGVRSSASRADITRDIPLRSHGLARDSNLTRSKSAVNLSTYPINHSSLWMTEYQRNYSKAMRS